MRFAVTSLRISAGIIVWALHFATIYGVTALACARGFAGSLPVAIAVATLVAVIGAAAILVSGWRRRSDFAHWLSASIAGFALLAIVFEAMPAWLVPTCA